MPARGAQIGNKNRLGKAPWNKGIKIDKEKYPNIGHTQKHTEETKKKMSEKAVGRKFSEERNKKISEAMKKRVVTQETREKLRKAKLNQSAETRRKISLAHKGKKNPSNSKENHFRWIKDRNKLRRYIGCGERRSPAYKAWRKEVCDRDDWKCRINNDVCEGRLEAHHIESFTNNPEIKYDVSNGICLCKKHHPRKRIYEKILINYFKELVTV
jgi:hypothetical protein